MARRVLGTCILVRPLAGATPPRRGPVGFRVPPRLGFAASSPPGRRPAAIPLTAGDGRRRRPCRTEAARAGEGVREADGRRRARPVDAPPGRNEKRRRALARSVLCVTFLGERGQWTSQREP